MKDIKNIIKSTVLAVCAGAATASCSLDMLPLNDVVLENFWTNKSDVENVVNSCYLGFIENSGLAVYNMIAWGELRSDNVVQGMSGTPIPMEVQYALGGNLQETNSLCNWGQMYTIINRCNTVCHYAPEVASKDPNYTASNLNQSLAEVKTLRAIAYFTLVRAFKDVPFSFDPFIDSDQTFQLPATKGEAIIDTLIADLEAYKQYAPNRYADKKSNYGRITRDACNAVLADMCLWRASDANLAPALQGQYYKRCVDYCQSVIDHKNMLYREDKDNDMSYYVDKDFYNNASVGGYPLITNPAPGNTKMSTAYYPFNALYSNDGGCMETIFQVSFSTNASDWKNLATTQMFGGYTSTGATAVTSFLAFNRLLLDEKPKTVGYNKQSRYLFSSINDFRSLTDFVYQETGDYPILKYAILSHDYNENDFGTLTSSIWEQAKGMTPRPYLMSYAPWILYRLSDVMLMSAEAKIQLAAIENGTENLEEAFRLISAVYVRSNPSSLTDENRRPKFADYNTVESMQELCEQERQREFLFEGKRYFDLVRRSRREGNTTHFQTALSNKFAGASKSILIKMAQLDFMYMPIAKGELDVNPLLKQNPAYESDKQSSKN